MSQLNTDNLVVRTVRALQDNYCYLVHHKGSDICLVIDPSDAAPIELALKEHNLRLGLILNTHHHHDHIDGNEELSQSHQAPIYCSEYDLSRIPNATRGLRDQETIEFENMKIKTVNIPGHTLGQVGFYFEQGPDLFVGDTLFSMGCGRLFEGTPQQMLTSLRAIAKLPPETRLHFGHEYTERNAAFALSVEPTNKKVQIRLDETRSELRSKGIARAPSVSDELAVNPFMRADSAEIRATLGMKNASDVEVFAKLREMRNTF